MATRLFSLALLIAVLVFPLFAAIGSPTVCKWKDDKSCAFTVGADDACGSQLDNMVPALKSRGRVATFWIISASTQFTSRLAAWRTAVRVDGCDFANHTAHHNGAANVVAADSEIGACARTIWQLNPGQGKLQLFMQGGGTTWSITSQQKIDLLKKYGVYPVWDEAGRGDGVHEGDYSNRSGATLKSYVDNAIRDGDWHFTVFHGTGGDWLPQDVSSLTELLDYMVSKKATVWLPTCTQAHKYKQERKTSHVSLVDTAGGRFRVRLTCDMDTALYDYPLTLKTVVPTAWDTCIVTQGTTAKSYASVAGTLMYEAVPGRAEVSIVHEAATGAVPGHTMRAGPGSCTRLVRRIGKAEGRVASVDCVTGNGCAAGQRYSLDGRRAVVSIIR